MTTFILKEITRDDFIKIKNFIKTQIHYIDNIIIGLPKNNYNLLLNINIFDNNLIYNFNLNFYQDGSLIEKDNKLSDYILNNIKDYILENLIIVEKKEINIII
jgi:hypothetical protein